MKKIYTLAALASGFAVLSFGYDAHACSCVEGAYLGGSVPADGDEGVPTNVVPLLGVIGEPRLFDSEGTEVPMEAVGAFNPGSGCTRNVELFPEAELEPNAIYTVTVESEFGEEGTSASMTFTTGDGPLEEEELLPPALNAGFFDAQNYLNSCVYAEVQACIAGKYEGLLEIRTLEDGEELSKYVTTFSDSALAYAYSGSNEVCVEVRARDLAGRRSKERSFCAKTKGLFVLPIDEDQWDAACSTDLVETLRAPESEGAPEPETESEPGGESNDEVVSNPENGADSDGGTESDEGSERVVSGCSLKEGPPKRSAWLWSLLPFAGFLARRRRAGAC